MNRKIEELGLLPADRLVVPKSNFRIIEHHAIYLGQDHRGVDLIAENKIGIGVRILSADDFFKDVIEITRIEKFPGNNAERKKAIQHALLKEGLPYNLINYNCQHFANEIQHRNIRSEQVDAFADGLRMAAVFTLLLGLFNYLLND